MTSFSFVASTHETNQYLASPGPDAMVSRPTAVASRFIIDFNMLSKIRSSGHYEKFPGISAFELSPNSDEFSNWLDRSFW